jgi:hypothetical protein
MKIFFKKPKQNKILIFDRQGLAMFRLFFYNSQFEVLDRRKESINIYIILKTIFNDGFKDFKSNYFKNYLKTVNPKVVLTFIDNNFRFFLLKKTFPTAKYICIQNGMRDSRYFSDLKRFKKINKNLEIDYYFTFSGEITKKISPLIKCRYFNIGSIINNHYSLNQKLRKYDFKKSITFISQFKTKFRYSEIVVLEFLSKFCEIRKIRFNILGKIPKSKIYLFKKNLKFKINCNFIPQENSRKSYQIINSSNMVVNVDSTLGYEALSKGIKTVFFSFGSLNPIKDIRNYINEIKFGYPFKYPNKGFFWLNYYNKKKMKLILEGVYNCPIHEWNKVYLPYKQKLMQYDKNNNKFKMVIKKTIKNFKFKNNIK